MSLPFSFSSLPNAGDAWGPPKTIPERLRFKDIPYAPFSKADKLGKVADWEAANDKQEQYGRNRNRERDPYHAYGASAATSFFASSEDAGEASSFSVVDSTGKAAPKSSGTFTASTGRGGSLRGGRGGARNFQSRNDGQQGNQRFHNNNNNRGSYNGGGNKFVRRPPAGFKEINKPSRVRSFSVEIGPDWRLMADIEFTRLVKLSLAVKEGEDVESYGTSYFYDKHFDSSSNKPLKIIDRTHVNPTASDDPVIQKLASESFSKVAVIPAENPASEPITPKMTVFTTDVVIGQLMCASKSLISWDVIVTKKGDKLFFDKRDSGPLDLLTVDENSADAPFDSDDEEKINSAQNLSLEATFVNQNFVVNAVNESEKPYPFEHPVNPFVAPEDAPEDPLFNKGYKYRKFILPSGSSVPEEQVPIVIRTEVDAVQRTNTGQPNLLSIKALNQYAPDKGLDWRTKLTTHRGAIVAAEIKKNSNKFARWTSQALITGVDYLKLGFVARKSPKDRLNHTILAVASYKPEDLALQMNLSLANGWGIVRSLIDIFSQEEDGKFIIVKDPNNHALKLFQIPEDAFVEEE